MFGFARFIRTLKKPKRRLTCYSTPFAFFAFLYWGKRLLSKAWFPLARRYRWARSLPQQPRGVQFARWVFFYIYTRSMRVGPETFCTRHAHK
ncbi:hypothetical protein LY78DRAFT_429151 [Colletotrichum sublineola]|nr:hypothetical protein LY78DRAFT_429151 [Colletotrichum sublineola]